MDRALKNLARLPVFYAFGDSEAKRNIVCSIFPEKLTFDGEQHRTLRVNEAIGVFDSVKAVFEQKKDRKTGAKSDLRSQGDGETTILEHICGRFEKAGFYGCLNMKMKLELCFN